MSNSRNRAHKIANWLKSGTGTQMLIKRILAVCAAILIVYGVGYAIGKLLFHMGA